MPTISVILPTNRVNGHFYQALDSLTDQDCEDLEIIVVFDGISPPSNLVVAFPMVREVTLAEPSGTPRALNAGLQASTAEFVGRLDADDIALPSRFRKQVAFMRRHPDVVGLGTAHDIISSDGHHLSSVSATAGDVRGLLLRRNPFVHSSMLYRAEAVKSAGGYNARCTRMQDYELHLRLAQEGPMCILQETLTQYRVHDEQNSRNSPVFSYSTREILRQRFALRRTLGGSRLALAVHSAAWVAWQGLRQLGIVRPRYLSRNV